MRIWPIAVLVVSFVLVGCGDDHGAPPHTAQEEKIVQETQNLTPQQQIDRAQNSPMPQSAKDALIKSIKEKNGMQ